MRGIVRLVFSRAVFFLALNFSGLNFIVAQDFSEIDSLVILKDLILTEKDHQKLSLLNFRLAFKYHYEQEDLDSAEYYHFQALKFLEAIGDTSRIAKTHYRLSSLYFTKSLMDRAIVRGHRALELYEAINDTSSMGNSQNVIGNVYNYLGEHDTAIEYYEEARDNFQRAGNFRGVGIIYSNLATIYDEEGDHEKSLDHSLRALDLYEDFGDDNDMMHEYANLGLEYKNLGDYQKAVEYEFRALQLAEKLGNKTFKVVTAKNLGLIHLAKKDYKTAIGYALQVMDMADEVGASQSKANAVEILVDSYKNLGDYRNSLRYLELDQEIDSVLYNQENSRIRHELQARYDLDKKEKENEILRQNEEINRAQIEQQQIINWVIGLGLGLLVGFSGFLYWINNKIKKQKIEIADQAEKLKQLDEYKSRFFANINHDLRTPLTLIKGYIHRINQDSESYYSTAAQSDIRKLEKNTDKLIKMTDEVRDLVLLENGRLSLTWNTVQLPPYLRLLTNMFSSAAEIRGISLSFETQMADSFYINLDRRQFEKIIYNLISNALKYTPEEGRISVALDLAGPDQVHISVSDTGKGISPKNKALIFERYYQATDNPFRSEEGTGIGLALAREIVELHGGTIEVQSQLGEGSTFEVLLPFNHDKTASEDVVDGLMIEELIANNQELSGPDEKLAIGNATVNSTEGSNTILIVDDHREIREYIAEIISDKYHIKQARNGKHALQVLAKEKIDLIVTDLMMPWLDGFQLIDRLKEDEALKTIPVMIVSARTTEEDKRRILDQGINNFISKPFDPVELTKRIDNIIGEQKQNASGSWEELVGDGAKVKNLEQNILKKINYLIVDRINDSSLAVRDIASEICASERKTYRLIKDLTDHTPLDYIKLIRFDYAKELITKGKVSSASEAAKAIGMSNVTQFNRQYRKHFGVSPG